MKSHLLMVLAVACGVLLLSPSPGLGDTQLIAEAFDSASGSDISSLGWTKLGAGLITVGEVVIDKGNAAYMTGNSAALYEKNLAAAQSIGAGGVATLMAVVKVQSAVDSSNRAGVALKSESGSYLMEMLNTNSLANGSATVCTILLPGQSAYAQFAVPQADVYDLKIMVTSQRARFYQRPHGTFYWNPVYECSTGASTVTGAQISLQDAGGSEFPRVDSVYLGYSDEFGKQWVRSHPFQIFAMAQLWGAESQITSNSGQFDRYADECGMNSLLIEMRLSSESINQIAIPAIDLLKQNGMVWHGLLGTASRSQEMIQRVGATSTAADDNAWLIYDEPGLSECAGVGLVRDWIRPRRPNALLYANAHPYTCWDEAWMEAYLSKIRPDVLMFDNYPYYDDTEWYAHLADGIEMYKYLAAYRAKALERRIPLWAWLQTWYGPNMESHRAESFPSGSDLRKQIFTYLAGGVKGFAYFIYDSTPNYIIGMIGVDGTKTPGRDGVTLFDQAADANKEIVNLGNCLKFLDSIDIRFIPGQVGNETPEGLINWSQGAGGEDRILSFSVTSPTTKSNGFIGCLEDDAGQKYFMLTNLNSGRTSTPAQTAKTFNITFNGSVSGVYRLNRTTGRQEWLPAANGVVSVTLPGGTGDLFTLSSAGFDLAAPSGTILIESGAEYTTSTTVHLTLSASDDHGIAQMRFSNDGQPWNQWEPYSTGKPWTMSAGEGMKVVYAQFRDAFGRDSVVISDTISLSGIVQNPVFSPGSRSFPAGISHSIGISCPTAGASIYYSTNGGAPSTLYTGPISISSDVTIKAMASRENATPSEVVTAAYAFLTPSVGSSGLDINGLLVRVWGRIAGSGGSGSDRYFYIDDGSGLYDGNELGYKGVRILAETLSETIAEGSYVSVTGIIRPWKIDGRLVHAVQPESDAQVSPF